MLSLRGLRVLDFSTVVVGGLRKPDAGGLRSRGGKRESPEGASIQNTGLSRSARSVLKTNALRYPSENVTLIGLLPV